MQTCISLRDLNVKLNKFFSYLLEGQDGGVIVIRREGVGKSMHFSPTLLYGARKVEKFVVKVYKDNVPVYTARTSNGFLRISFKDQKLIQKRGGLYMKVEEL